jgi:hypothetical protein
MANFTNATAAQNIDHKRRNDNDSEDEQEEYIYKIVIIGDGAVGFDSQFILHFIYTLH